MPASSTGENSSRRVIAHTLGTWCRHDDAVTHCVYVPNAFRLGGSDVINLIYSEVGRARWVAETIYGDDWEKNRDATGRPLAKSVR